MTDALVSIHDLGVRLGDKTILKGINTGIRRGAISALIGLNGSGKTTLLKALLREVPYTGRVQFHCGHDHTHPMPHHIGYVPQRLHIDAKFPLTVRDLFALALQRRPLFLGVSQSTRKTMDELLQRVWAQPEISDRLVEKLSAGQLQRVLLALALYPQPELLLLDEPAAGVDFVHGEKFYDLITRLNRDTGMTIVLVSHDIKIVHSHVQHVLCLRDGSIQCEGPPHEILTGANIAEIFGAEMGVYVHQH